jgi:hypothetical protein
MHVTLPVSYRPVVFDTCSFVSVFKQVTSVRNLSLCRDTVQLCGDDVISLYNFWRQNNDNDESILMIFFSLMF